MGRTEGDMDRQGTWLYRKGKWVKGQKHRKQEKIKSTGKGKGVHKSGKAVPGHITLLLECRLQEEMLHAFRLRKTVHVLNSRHGRRNP